MEDYVSFEQAKSLKELRFDWKCYTFYPCYNWCGLSVSSMYENHNIFEKSISAPTLAQAQNWLRKVKKTEVIVNRLDDNVYSYSIYGEIVNVTTERTFDIYEDALSAGINDALEILTR